MEQSCRTQLKSVVTLSANPCIVTQRRMPTPIDAIFCESTHTPVRPGRCAADIPQSAECVDHDALEIAQIAQHVAIGPGEFQNRIADQLAGAMVGDLAAARDAIHGNIARADL